MGMPPPEPGVHSTFPPRRWGGNIDCKELVAGTTLYLPIPVEGALFSAGDGHAAQGDGEVSGTAIEAPTRAQLTLDLQDDLELEWPDRTYRRCLAHVRLRRGHLGVAAADRARRHARAAWDGSSESSGADALALASLAVDLRVTQVVNGAQGVHAVLRDDAIRSQ